MKSTKILSNVILFFILFVNFQIVQGQALGKDEVKMDSLYFESPSLFECKIQFPANYNPNNSFPMIINLHGGGGSYLTFSNVWSHFENPQFILATPQAPYKWLMGDDLVYDWLAWPSNDLKLKQKAVGTTSRYIRDLIISLTKKYNVDNLFLMGFSQGSIVAHIAGLHNHELLNGLIIISGPELNHPGKSEIVWPDEETVKSANHLKICLVHGKKDNIVEFDLAKKSKTIFEKYGYNVTLFDFEDGHKISTEGMRKVESWLNRIK